MKSQSGNDFEQSRFPSDQDGRRETRDGGSRQIDVALPRRQVTGRVALALTLLMAFGLAVPGPTLAAVVAGDGWGDHVPSGEPAASSEGRFEHSIYRARTHSVQKTSWYCVPTTIQMMLNLIKGESDRSKANQAKYWRFAQANSRYPVRDNGADPAGWVAALDRWGAGTYTVAVNSTMQSALREAATRMRMTGKPVGLIVWGNGGTGGHAWVMTGFKSTADPRTTAAFSVTSVQAMGSLWPHGTINGSRLTQVPSSGSATPSCGANSRS